MDDTHTIREITSQLRGAENFKAVFGNLAGKTPAERKQSLRKSFTYLVRMVHPDHVPKACAAEAAAAFTLLTKVRDAAAVAVEQGTYESGYVADIEGSQSLTFVSKTATYTCRDTALFTGDFAQIYAGSIKGTGERVHVKIAHEPSQNSFLAREALLHQRLAKLSGVARFVPHALDSFLAHGEHGTLHRVNVTRAREGYVSVARLLSTYPRGLLPEDAAWVARRVFAQAILAKMAGVVQGALLPEHTLVHPTTHEPLHLGWIHAVDVGPRARIAHVVDRYRAWYPSEVFEKKEVDERTDIAMAARTAIALFSGSSDQRTFPKTLPDRLARFFGRCVEQSPSRRVSEATAALDELTSIVRATWGRTYRPLSLPI